LSPWEETLTPLLPWKTAWVTGAATGIGREVAVQLAAAGVKVAASDRVVDKLQDLARQHPGITAYPLDVTDGPAFVTVARSIEAELGPVDLAVLCAGILHSMGATTFDRDRALQSMDVNYCGILRALNEMMPRMIARKSGHVAVVASVTGYRSFSDTGAYGPTKAALISLAEGLKLDLERFGVTISVVNPGYVDTQITQSLTYERPAHMLTPTQAATKMIAGLKAKRYEITFPWQTVWPVKVMRFMPNSWFFWLSRKIDEKTGPRQQ
jgi:short-subunit dehydrogenase